MEYVLEKTLDHKAPERPSGRQWNAQRSTMMARAANVRRIDALFQAMETDFLLREQFITGPSRILTEYLDVPPVTAEQAACTDRLVYAVFANAKLLQWLQDYVHDHTDRVPTGPEFLADFCEATVGNRGQDIVAALLEGCVTGTGIHGLTEDLLHYFVNLHAAHTLCGDENGRHGGAQAESPEGVGIEPRGITPLTSITWTTWIRTTQAEEAHAFGSDFAPPYTTVTLDGLARYAVELRARGALGLG
ncbi:hypothetical protein R1T08_00310 [Streptomyces sp. SBC-4]|nr:hypothetical protein [Streptomyces sp. SBC-4]MDV5142808.1 hypothetical protein [Streptomyces sp. SBC-4]